MGARGITAACLGAAITTCGAAGAATGAVMPTTGRVAATPATAVARLDAGSNEVLLTFDGSGKDGGLSLASTGTADVDARVSAVSSGAVTRTADRLAGSALRTEAFDPSGPAHPAVLVVRRTDGTPDVTDPGSRDFSFGAEFTLDTLSQGSSTDNGNNLVQRGLFGQSSQYKVQLDDRVPYCRIHGSAGTVSVRAGTRVEPDAWYRARCRRVGNTVSLRLVTFGTSSDGGYQDAEQWSESGAIGALSYGGRNPMSVGGKVDSSGDVLASDSDQFNGRIDNAFFRYVD